jgi:hypothetical protein
VHTTGYDSVSTAAQYDPRATPGQGAACGHGHAQLQLDVAASSRPLLWRGAANRAAQAQLRGADSPYEDVGAAWHLGLRISGAVPHHHDSLVAKLALDLPDGRRLAAALGRELLPVKPCIRAAVLLQAQGGGRSGLEAKVDGCVHCVWTSMRLLSFQPSRLLPPGLGDGQQAAGTSVDFVACVQLVLPGAVSL